MSLNSDEIENFTLSDNYDSCSESPEKFKTTWNVNDNIYDFYSWDSFCRDKILKQEENTY